ncbi:MAG: rRNA maturation RNase YbeY [Betaproteobacteria bacterium]|nr:rRNA maturation RNase YbeY [Betaproteobacteria bacterium]
MTTDGGKKVRKAEPSVRGEPGRPVRGGTGQPGAAGGGRRLVLAVQYACQAEGLPGRADIRRWLRAAWDGGGEVTVRLVDQKEGRELNAAWRGRDNATNVLSFPYEAPPRLAGDLVLCAPVVEQEAHAQEKPLASHYAHLMVHGMLHLLGWDHESEEEAALMEAKEREILAALGIADPYAAG